MQTGLKINISQQTKEGKNALEKLKSFMFAVYNQDLLLPPFTVQEHPEGSVWWPLGSTEKLKPGSVAAEAEHTSLPRGAARTQSCCPPCQQQAEQSGSIPADVLTNARPLPLAALPAGQCQICCTCAALGSALPSFLNPRATVILNKDRDHLAPCSQMVFYLQVEMLLYLCGFPFPVHPPVCMDVCSYL